MQNREGRGPKHPIDKYLVILVRGHLTVTSINVFSMLSIGLGQIRRPEGSVAVKGRITIAHADQARMQKFCLYVCFYFSTHETACTANTILHTSGVPRHVLEIERVVLSK